MEEQVGDIVGTVHGLPLTKLLYTLKELGNHPVIRVLIDKETHQPDCAILKAGGVDYYFHATKGSQEQDIPIKADDRGDRVVYDVPFDGWEVSVEQSE